MKKGLFYLSLILVLSIPAVLADISVYGPDYSSYNLGDKIAVTVSISSGEYLQGLLKVSLKCQSNSLNYFTVPIELTSGKEERINIPPVIATKNLVGDCIIEGSLYSNEEKLIESALSEKFMISNSLIVTVKLDKINIMPNDKLKISGIAETIRGENVKDGSVKITISDFSEEFSTLVDNGDFNFIFTFGGDIKSGSHLITSFVEDNFGNSGIGNIEFSIEAVPTELKNSINQLSFKPEETIEIEALLFDQVRDLIVTNVLIKIIDADRKEVLEKEISTDSILRFTFPKYALPGGWLIKSKAGKLNIESYVDVEVVKKIEFLINGQNLIITNVGNVGYREPLNIFFEDKTVTKKTSLKPGETASIDLSKEVEESASYDIKIVSGNEEETFEDVFLQHTRKSFGELITGNFVLGTAGKIPSFVYYLIVGVVIIGFLVVSYFNSKKREEKKIKKHAGKEKEEGKRWADGLRARKETKKESGFTSYDKEEAIKRFRERVKLEAEEDRKKPIFKEKYYIEKEPKEKPFNLMVDKVKEEVPIKEDKPFENFERPFERDAIDEREVIDFTLDNKKEEVKEKSKDIDEGSLFKMFD